MKVEGDMHGCHGGSTPIAGSRGTRGGSDDETCPGETELVATDGFRHPSQLKTGSEYDGTF